MGNSWNQTLGLRIQSGAERLSRKIVGKFYRPTQSEYSTIESANGIVKTALILSKNCQF